MFKSKNVNYLQKIVLETVLVLVMAVTVLGAGTPQATVPAGEKIPVFNCEEGFGIRNALAMLGGLCDKNIVPSQGVNGELAFRTLKNVTFDEAMNAILGENFVYEQQGNLIKVFTKDEYKKIKEDEGRMAHRIFVLYYISAEDASSLIKPVLSAKAKIEKSSKADTGVTGGASGTGGAAGSSGGGGDSMAMNETIVIYDYPENIEKAAEVLKSIDIRPKQVLVEATILSATLTENTKFGIDWNLMGGVNLTGTAATSDLVSGDSISRGTTATTPIGQIANSAKTGVGGSPIEQAGFAAAPGSNGLRVGATSGNMAVFLTALENVTDVTILANPKILAVNKQQGYLQIGKTLHYRGATTIGQSGVASQGEDKSLPTGTVLVFRPYIGNDGYIRMDIYPKDSTATLNANDLPDETTAEVKTNVLVKDGETVVIGGLFRDVVTTGRSQVPLLGDLPIVGVLFRGTTDVTEKQEVMVLLTPHIINEPADADGKARADDIARKSVGAKDELQWIDRSRLAEDAYTRAVTCYMEDDYKSALKELGVALNLRPTYLEAIRLKERIISETNPESAQKLERIELKKVERQEASSWQR
jgi:type IV pilus assembly protein PilQ